MVREKIPIDGINKENNVNNNQNNNKLYNLVPNNNNIMGIQINSRGKINENNIELEN